MDDLLDLALVRRALGKLEHDQQSVIIMRFIEELPTKAVAHALGKSEGAVRVIQHRALKQLKKHIDDTRAPRATT